MPASIPRTASQRFVLRAGSFSGRRAAARYAAGVVRAVRLHGGSVIVATTDEHSAGWVVEVACFASAGKQPSDLQVSLRAHGRAALRVLGGAEPRNDIEREAAVHAGPLENFAGELARHRLLIGEDIDRCGLIVHARREATAAVVAAALGRLRVFPATFRRRTRRDLFAEAIEWLAADEPQRALNAASLAASGAADAGGKRITASLLFGAAEACLSVILHRNARSISRLTSRLHQRNSISAAMRAQLLDQVAHFDPAEMFAELDAILKTPFAASEQAA